MRIAFAQLLLILTLSGIAAGGYNLWLESNNQEKHLAWMDKRYKGFDLIPKAGEAGEVPPKESPDTPGAGAQPSGKAPAAPAGAPVEPKTGPGPEAGTRAAKSPPSDPAVPAPSVPVAAPAGDGEFRMIGLDAAAEAYRDGSVFLDARRSRDYELGHIPGARPMSAHEGDLLEKIAKLRDEEPLEAPLVIYCTNSKDCEDSKIVGRQLKEVGFLDISIYLGGFPEWEKEKRPVAKGKEPGRREEP